MQGLQLLVSELLRENQQVESKYNLGSISSSSLAYFPASAFKICPPKNYFIIS